MTPALSTRRLAAITLTVFVLILAFLAGRVHAGADPTQATAPTSSVTRSEPAPADGDAGAAGSGADPYEVDPYGTAPYGGDPYGGDPYGGAPPSSAPDQGGGGAVPDADPPSTFAS